MATKKTTKAPKGMEQQIVEELVAPEESIPAEEPVAPEGMEQQIVEEPVVPEETTPTEEPAMPELVPTDVVQTGKVVSILKVATGNCADYHVRFPRSFDEGTEPDIVVGFLSSSTAARFGTCACAVLEGSVNNEGFTIRFYNGDTSSRIPHFSWIAFGTITK